MNKGNFRAECTFGLGSGTFTENKIYDVIDGKISFDTGEVFENINTIDELNDRMTSKFRLLYNLTDVYNLSDVTDDLLITEVRKRGLLV